MIEEKSCTGGWRLRTDVGVWRVSTIKNENGRFETAVKHKKEPKHRGYVPVIEHCTTSSARADHAMVVRLLRTLAVKEREASR